MLVAILLNLGCSSPPYVVAAPTESPYNPALDAEPGFRGALIGALRAELPPLTAVKKLDEPILDLTAWRRPDEFMYLGQARLDQVTYRIKADRLHEISVEALGEHCAGLYGWSEANLGARGRETTERGTIWRGEHVIARYRARLEPIEDCLLEYKASR